MSEEQNDIPLHIEHKYLAITAIARRAKELSRQYYQTHSIGDSGFDPLDSAIKDLEEDRLIVYKRDEITGELEPYTD